MKTSIVRPTQYRSGEITNQSRRGFSSYAKALIVSVFSGLMLTVAY